MDEIRVVLDSRDVNDFVLTRADPHGHWVIHRDKGTLPEVLKGLYTTREMALTDIKNYLNTFALPRRIKDIKDTVKA